MPRVQSLSLLPLAFLCLASCASTSVDVERLPPPPSALEPCAVPQALPQRALNDQEVELYWGRDRDALRSCGSRHAALATWSQ